MKHTTKYESLTSGQQRTKHLIEQVIKDKR